MNEHIDGAAVSKIIIIEAKQKGGVEIVQVSNVDAFSRTKTTIFKNSRDVFMYLIMGYTHVMGHLHTIFIFFET
jgi:hypothetical protein